jgi:hypothetical protein
MAALIDLVARALLTSLHRGSLLFSTAWLACRWIIGGVETSTFEDSIDRVIDPLSWITTAATLDLIVAILNGSLQRHELITHHASILIRRHLLLPL